MKVAYFVPCYIDAFAPEAAKATYQLLKRFPQIDVEFVNRAACCGLPLKDMGYQKGGCKIEKNFAPLFKGFDAIVLPSGICTEEIKDHFDSLEQTDEIKHLRENVFDIVLFLHDVLKVTELPWAKFPHKVALHNGCHSLRYLHHAKPTEIMHNDYSKTEDLLKMVEGIDVCYASRKDECCGFGGTFSVWSADCAGQMGEDKVNDYHNNHLEIVTSADFTCLLHQETIAKKMGKPIKTFYIAEILNGSAQL